MCDGVISVADLNKNEIDLGDLYIIHQMRIAESISKLHSYEIMREQQESNRR